MRECYRQKFKSSLAENKTRAISYLLINLSFRELHRRTNYAPHDRSCCKKFRVREIVSEVTMKFRYPQQEATRTRLARYDIGYVRERTESFDVCYDIGKHLRFHAELDRTSHGSAQNLHERAVGHNNIYRS